MMQKMEGIQILDLMGNIDMKYVEEAEEERRRPGLRFLPSVAVACLCIVVGIAGIKAGIIGGRKVKNTQQGMQVSQKVVTMSAEAVTETAEMLPESATLSQESFTESDSEMAREMVNGAARTKETDEEDYESYKMISSYDVSSEEMAAKLADYAVRSGECFMSISLRGAMDAYGDEVRYRVVVDIFRDGIAVAPDGEIAAKERERLFSEGYVVAMETENYGTNTQTFFTLHATFEQLNEFHGLEEYGYGLWLYGEKTKTAGDNTVEVYNGGAFVK